MCIITFLLLSCALFSGCSIAQNTDKTPQQLITDGYGNNTYNISFSSEGLDEPIRDMTYTANSMPKLPTPEKVGYIFSGWFMDKELTTPYVDGILYLYMQDVVMYPKWIKEEFIVNGVYEIKYSAEILDNTVKLGSKTEQYGGYKDFTKSLIEDEICIEKSDGKKLLRLRWDSEMMVPFGYTAGVFDVSVSRETGSNIYIEDVVNSQTETIKTLFLNIDNADLTETIYLDVYTTNYNSDVPISDYNATTTSYTVAFDITKIIGFSSAYVDPDTTLDEGWYLVKTFFRNSQNEPNMGSTYNPVYSYIYSDGTNYTLIKQNIPYDGLIYSLFGELNTNYVDNYYSRGMTFIPVQLYYDIDLTSYGTKPVDTNGKYLPEIYNGGHYGDYTIEFHADELKYYNIFDLGNSVKKSFMVQSAVTGFMEVSMQMGALNQILTIDYDHIIKLAKVDYTPLSGDAYQYNSSMQYYPSGYADVNNRNMTYDAISEYGITTDMINFYFSASGLDAPVSSRSIYSSKITVSPTLATNALTVADSRYTIAHFDINTQVYGYDSTKEDLYADEMRVQTFGTNGIRETVPIRTGKSCNIGERIRLADIYAEKVDRNYDFAKVNYVAYKIKNGKPDYSEQVRIEPTFAFENDLAILFTTEQENGIKSTLVELVEYSEPIISIISSQDFPYDANATYTVSEKVAYPDVRYSWMGKNGEFIDYYFNVGMTDNGMIIHNGNVILYSMSGNKYTTIQYNSMRSKDFTIPSNVSALVYQLTNLYGERYLYSVVFDAQSKTYYHIYDESGEELETNGVSYNEYGERNSVWASFSSILTKDNYIELLSRQYSIAIKDETADYIFSEYSIYTDSSYNEGIVASLDATENINSIWDAIKDSKYAYLKLIYKHGEDKITVYYLYNIYFNGKLTMDVMQYNDYFINHRYSMQIPILYGADGTELATGEIYANAKFNDQTVSKYQMDVTFKEVGDCTITYSFYLYGKYFGGAKTNCRLTHSQKITLISDLSDVKIKYVTDDAHPYEDGTTEREIVYSLAGNIFTLTKTSFVTGGDILYGWISDPMDDMKYAYKSGVGIADFISDFNTNYIILFAIWDPGFVVVMNVNGKETTCPPSYLSDNGTYGFNPENYIIDVPKGYQYIGFTGGFIGDQIIATTTSVSYYNVKWDDPDYFKVRAVFVKIHTVGFSIDETYADLMLNFKPNVEVVDGHCVKNPGTYSVVCRDGYEFKGWYVKGDDSKTIINLATYVITENTTFVALFGEIGS